MKQKIPSLFVLILIGVYVIGMGLYCDGIDFRDKNNQLKIAEIFALSGIIVGGVTLGFLFIKEKHQWEKLSLEFDYLSGNTLTPILLGFGFASIIVGVGIYCFRTESASAVNEKIFEIITVYITTIASFLVLRAFFDKLAPITTVDLLLESIIDDLENHSKLTCEAWLVYPALNIGGFRNSKYYAKYKQKLISFAGEPKTTLTAFTYYPDLYEKLYTCYDLMYEGRENKKPIEHNTTEAHSFVTHIKSEAKNNCLVKGFSPSELTSHVVVIGDVVYFINSFGLPIYDESNASFSSPFENMSKDKIDNLATLIAFRYENKNFASSIKHQLLKMAEKGQEV